MGLMNYNIKAFCAEAEIKIEDFDADFWLALDRTTRCELVRCWWLDNDDKGYSAGKGAEACAAFFASKTNSIRGLQNEVFKDQIAPWQEGYASEWRASVPEPEQQALVEGAKPRTERAPTNYVVSDEGIFSPRYEGGYIQSCPTCLKTAFTHEELLELFGTRKMRSGPRPQSLCKKCRGQHAKDKIAAARARLQVPGTEA